MTNGAPSRVSLRAANILQDLEPSSGSTGNTEPPFFQEAGDSSHSATVALISATMRYVEGTFLWWYRRYKAPCSACSTQTFSWCEGSQDPGFAGRRISRRQFLYLMSNILRIFWASITPRSPKAVRW